MLQEAQAIQHYLQYLGQKYIAPHKALDEEEFMLQFKQDGGKARNQFKKIVEAFNDQQNLLKMQRVSNWMNQAQFGTHYLQKCKRLDILLRGVRRLILQ